MSIDPKTLAQFQQGHLLQFWPELSPDAQRALTEQLQQIDFPLLHKLASQSDEAVDWGEMATKAEPPPAVKLDDPAPPFSVHAARAAGEAALRAGQVGMILVAGGQGTRLGFNPPKGMFPIGPVSHRTLFQMHCDRLVAIMQRFATSIPMYIMTSPATDGETRSYFDEQNRCGLSAEQLQIFCQGTMPAVDAKTGQILLADKGTVALSPDGHGGLVDALDRHGCLEDARQRGIEHIYYAQVDNPLAQLCDPELIGYHILSKSQLTTQVVKKRFATERVGNVVSIGGKVQIIEYSDLPETAAQQTLPDGSLKLWAGNIAVHVFDRSFLADVVASADGLPFHRAHKKVPYVDSNGRMMEPSAPNAIKFERFVFDLLPMAERAFVVEGDAAQIFAPVKNADGAQVDTPTHTRQAISGLHRQWLEEAGAEFAAGVTVEIHPAWALDAKEVGSKLSELSGPVRFQADTYLR